jgi:hypothetical protein
VCRRTACTVRRAGAGNGAAPARQPQSPDRCAEKRHHHGPGGDHLAGHAATAPALDPTILGCISARRQAVGVVRSLLPLAGASAAVWSAWSATSKEVPCVRNPIIDRAGSLRAGALRVRADDAGRILGRLRGQSRDAYTPDLRQFTAWCLQHGRRLFDVRRVDIECFAREMEDHGMARATVARRCARFAASTAARRRKG